LVYVTDSDFVVTVAWWTGTASIALGFLLMLQILFLRWLLNRRLLRREKFVAVWQLHLMDCIDEVPGQLPKIRKADTYSFLTLWNYLHESVRDEPKERLNRLARTCDMDAVALHLARSGNLREKLMGLATLGNLRDDTTWSALADMAAGDDATVSLAAARALMRIDARRAIELLMPLIATHKDWSLSFVGIMLKEAGADIVSEPLAGAALAATPEYAPRLIGFLETAYANVRIPTLRRILHSTNDTETIIAVLRIWNDPEDIESVREFSRDDRWQVRVQAVRALGRTGTQADEQLLLGALADPEWWVRYRAAQSLAGLPSVSREKLARFREGQYSEYARDILAQVIAERRLAS
jgi:HEAT repeats